MYLSVNYSLLVILLLSNFVLLRVIDYVSQKYVSFLLEYVELAYWDFENVF